MDSLRKMGFDEFMLATHDDEMRAVDRAMLTLWYSNRYLGMDSLTAGEINSKLHQECGYPKQNTTRLNGQLKDDRRFLRKRRVAWGLYPNQLKKLDEEHKTLVESETNTQLDTNNEFIPSEIIRAVNRGYIEDTLYQINMSYQVGLYTCSSVMCRKIVESLIIELYERHKKSNVIKDKAKGYFFPFDELINILEKGSDFNLSRDSVKTIKAIKKLGDQSAHNRRFRAHKTDLDGIRTDLRILTQELAHLCNAGKP